MGCCGDREKLVTGTNEQRWDYINLSDFKATSCWSGFSYFIVYYFLIISLGVYVVDLYTASNLLFFDRWSSQVKPAIPFEISRWVFAGCIFLSWIQLAYRWWKAVRAMKSGYITASYLDPLAVRVESIRPGKARGWRRFLVFAALTKGRKGSEYVALFAYFNFEAWTRVIFAEGPRQVINGVTLYSVLRAKLIPVGAHAPNDGHTAIVQFFVNIRILANANTQQATILFGMLYVLIIWVFSALSLAVAFLMYIFFLWHHIPSTDGSLTKFCRRKIEKRLNQIVKEKVDKAIAKEQIERVGKVATGGAGASVGMPTTDFKRQPTLPMLDGDGPIPSAPLSRQTTQTDLAPFGSRPASPFIDRPASPAPRSGSNTSSKLREPILPNMITAARPPAPSRNTTKSSLHSNASFGSDAPLMGGAAAMGFSDRRNSPPDGRFPDREQSHSRTPGAGPPPRSFTGLSSNSARSTPPPRSNTAFSPPPRSNTAFSNASASASSRSMTPGAGALPPRGDSQRRPLSPPDSSNFAPFSSSSPRRTPRPQGPVTSPSQEFEMHTAGRSRPMYAPPQQSKPRLPPSMDYFGESRVPSRAGTAPVGAGAGYDDSIYDAYADEPARPLYRPGTAGPGPRPGPPGHAWSGNGNGNPGMRYNPPRF